MATLVCPNCGNEIVIPALMPDKVTCKSCKWEFGVQYEGANLTFREKIQIFGQKHKTQIAYAVVCAFAALKAYFWFQDQLAQASSESDVSSTESEQTTVNSDSNSSEHNVESAHSSMNLNNYDTKLVQHPMRVRNLHENQFPSSEKIKQAHDLGIDLGEHQTLVDPFPQRHHTKKTE